MAGDQQLGTGGAEHTEAGAAASFVMVEHRRQQLRSAAPQQRMAGHQSVTRHQHGIDQVGTVARRVSGGRQGHRPPGQRGGDLRRQRRGPGDPGADQTAFGRDLRRPRHPVWAPRLAGQRHRRNLFEVVTFGVRNLGGVAVDRGVVGLREPDGAAHVIDVGVGQQDRPDVAGPETQTPQRPQHVVAVSGEACVDEHDAGVVVDQRPVDQRRSGQVYQVGDGGEHRSHRLSLVL